MTPKDYQEIIEGIKIDIENIQSLAQKLPEHEFKMTDGQLLYVLESVERSTFNTICHLEQALLHTNKPQRGKGYGRRRGQHH
jgi:hypothetical protein